MNREKAPKQQKPAKKTKPKTKPLFIEDLETRRNASAPVTTLALGEETSGW